MRLGCAIGEFIIGDCVGCTVCGVVGAERTSSDCELWAAAIATTTTSGVVINAQLFI